MSQNYSFQTTDGFNIFITTYGNSNLEKGNCLILVHGFKGFKDWGFGPHLGEFFAQNKYFVITFNFSHNGIGENFTEFTELDKFAENTYSREISELNQIISAYKNNFFGKKNSDNKIGLIGHSRGGAISIIEASKNKNVDALVAWATISNFDRFTQKQKDEWYRKGFIEVLNVRTRQKMRMNISFLEDFEKNSELLNIEKALSKIEIPFLILHGDQDLAVSIKEAEIIYNLANKNFTQLEIIKGTGHTFDIKHPFEGSSKVFDIVKNKTLNFFNSSFSEN
ncbi:MAG: acyl-CoA thioester hydrolase/BAAT C-terminal domain-containing protein [Melioribacteraceae bacterium]